MKGEVWVLVHLRVLLRACLGRRAEVCSTHTCIPATLLQVRDESRPIKYLNELEWVEGEVWANVWQTECIARIDPKTGIVKCGPNPTA